MAADTTPDLLRQGITKAQELDKEGARQLFEQLARQEPNHETVWLWLSSVAPDMETSANYLERALEVDPQNQQARQWLSRLRPPAKERSAWRCPLCRQPSTAKPLRCARCRSSPDILPIERFLNAPPGAADEEWLDKATTRIAKETQLTTSERHRLLALAALNQGHFLKALIQLGALSTLHPEDPDLQQAVETLTEHVEQQPGFNDPVQDPTEFQTAELDLTELGKEASSAHIRRPTVLVVDDSPTVRTLVSNVLKKHGYRTQLASDGMEALTLIRETVPDLVLLDVTMPHLDGFKICRVIKDNDLTAHVPVVFLSGKDGFFDKVRGRMAGAVDYLSKPVSSNTLLQVMQRHCDIGITEDASTQPI